MAALARAHLGRLRLRRDAHDRLEDLREQIGDGLWSQALARVSADPGLVADLTSSLAEGIAVHGPLPADTALH